VIAQLQLINITIIIITNKMQRYTIFFITVNALHVSGGFSAHHQELKNCTHSIGYVHMNVRCVSKLTAMHMSVRL
jgi:hypothetical protein